MHLSLDLAARSWWANQVFISHSYWKCERNVTNFTFFFSHRGHFWAILWSFSLILSHFVLWLTLAGALPLTWTGIEFGIQRGELSLGLLCLQNRIFLVEYVWQMLTCSLRHFGIEIDTSLSVLVVTPRLCFFLLRLGVRAASNSAYSGYPELWILRYTAHRYHAVPSPGFEPTTLWLRVRHPNHSATTLQVASILAPHKQSWWDNQNLQFDIISSNKFEILVFIGSQGDPLFLHRIFPSADCGNQIAPLLFIPNLENAVPQ
jgi:hypothetical protein